MSCLVAVCAVIVAKTLHPQHHFERARLTLGLDSSLSDVRYLLAMYSPIVEGEVDDRLDLLLDVFNMVLSPAVPAPDASSDPKPAADSALMGNSADEHGESETRLDVDSTRVIEQTDVEELVCKMPSRPLFRHSPCC